jgi:hypothetical protein
MRTFKDGLSEKGNYLACGSLHVSEYKEGLIHAAGGILHLFCPLC